MKEASQAERDQFAMIKETNPKDDTLPRENKRCMKEPFFRKHDKQ